MPDMLRRLYRRESVDRTLQVHRQRPVYPLGVYEAVDLEE